MEVSKRIEIKKLTIKMGDKQVEVTVEEARRLKAVLEELFGKEVVKETVLTPYPLPYPVYPMPIRPYYWEYQQPIVYCTSGSIENQGSTVMLNMDYQGA